MDKTLQELGRAAFKRYSQNLTKLRGLELKPSVAEYLKLKNSLDGDTVVIREAAAENLKGFENEQIKVVVVRSWKKWYDIDILKAQANPRQWAIIQEKCLTMELDKANFEKLVKENDLSNELKQAAFREEEQTPRVSIKEINA